MIKGAESFLHNALLIIFAYLKNFQGLDEAFLKFIVLTIFFFIDL